MGANVASCILDESPILSLSVKIAESIQDQVIGNLKPHSLNCEQWVVLKLVESGDAQRPSQLSKIMGISCPRITRIIDQLEQRGFIERAVGVEDRRVFKILLTEKGEAIAKRAVKIASLLPLIDESDLTEKEKILFDCFLENRQLL